MLSILNFQNMCQIDQHEGTASFAAIIHVLRVFFFLRKKNMRGPLDPLGNPWYLPADAECTQFLCEPPVCGTLSKAF